MTAVFLCTDTHHGFSWLPGNKNNNKNNNNNMTYITRQAWECAVSVSGVYFIDVEVPCIVKKMVRR